jgi:NTE family protein
MAERRTHQEDPVVAVVLSGGGARGAYEAGVLSVLLPLMEDVDRPRIVLGTSAGALNAAMLASALVRDEDPVKALIAEGWNRIEPPMVFATPRSSVPRLAEKIVRRGTGALGLLDTSPLRATLAGMLPCPLLGPPGEQDALVAAAVVASSCETASAVVFYESERHPRSEPGLEYVKTELGIDHLMASSAFPLAFPACWVEERGRGWYIDGGVHLNTPIKPAIDFGADRILIVGATPWELSQSPERTKPPNFADGGSQLLHAMLVDSVRADLRQLIATNRQVQASASDSIPQGAAGGHRLVEFCTVNPSDDVLSEVAGRTWPSGVLDAIRSLGDYRALGLMTAQCQRPGQFLSYLCFSPEFIEEAIALGTRDAERLVGTSKRIPWRLE